MRPTAPLVTNGPEQHSQAGIPELTKSRTPGLTPGQNRACVVMSDSNWSII